MENIQSALERVIQKLFGQEVSVELTRPGEQFGDWATNVALQLAGKLNKPPREVAEQVREALQKELGQQAKDVTVAGPGFINIVLSDEAIVAGLEAKPAQGLKDQEILVEFGDPNPFKAMHLGHLYTAIVGDAIARLLERAGADVKRLSYHGDVGMHVAKALWAREKEDGANAAGVFSTDTMWGHLYAKGNAAYKEDSAAKAEIENLNQAIYAWKVNNSAVTPQLRGFYEEGFGACDEAFKGIFTQLGIKYIKHYYESQSAKAGLEYVKQNIGKVFEKSDGAVIYRGEKVGLHTRVFINSRGLPTYEAKDLGLTELKNRDFPKAAQSIIITANEQAEYFKVMLAALSEFDPSTAAKTRHISHGFLSMSAGKMSSRAGIRAEQTAANLIAAVHDAVAKQYPELAEDVRKAVYLAALKYAFLKNRIGGDIVFNIEESVALEGNSGPYLQYAHARARSILHNAEKEGVKAEQPVNLEEAERSLARKLTEYPDVLARATEELMPHHICTYLYELAQIFNRFYEHNRVMGDKRQATRLALVQAYASTLQDGLHTLGIDAPDRL